MMRVVKVLPHPGPPVRTRMGELPASTTACFCAAVRVMPAPNMTKVSNRAFGNECELAGGMPYDFL